MVLQSLIDGLRVYLMRPLSMENWLGKQSVDN
jgi:hypothetical protein